MRVGRPRKPLKLHLLHGTSQKSRLNFDEPQPEVSIPDPPPELNGKALDEWNRVAPQLVQLGILTDLDRPGLAAYCASWAQWLEAQEELKKGVIFKAPKTGYPMVSPWVFIASAAAKQMHRFLTEFGLSPASRTRIKGSAAGPKPKSGVHKFLA
jgi:P27 family predicted phage terminase small subunit